MPGWTVFREFSPTTTGGVSVVRLQNGDGRLIAWGADTHLYVAPFDPTDPGRNYTASIMHPWTKTGLVADSEPQCQPVTAATGALYVNFSTLLCGWRGIFGDVQITFFDTGPLDADLVWSAGSLRVMGGVTQLPGFQQEINPGGLMVGQKGRPTILPAPQRFAVRNITNWTDSSGANAVYYDGTHDTFIAFEALAWNGAFGMSRYASYAHYGPTHSELSSAAVGPLISDQNPGWNAQWAPQFGSSFLYFKDPWADRWTAMQGIYAGPMDCVRVPALVCAVAGLTNRVSLVRADGYASFAQAPPIIRSSGPLPAALNPALAPVLVQTAAGNLIVVARGANGRIYRAAVGESAIGPWIDEGGATQPDAGVSCVANGEQPVCFVRGLDGRIWWRMFDG